MPHRQYMHKPTVIKDLIIMLVVNLLLWGLFVNVDALELLYQASRNNESLELDELIPLGITIGLSLLIFSYLNLFLKVFNLGVKYFKLFLINLMILNNCMILCVFI